MRNDFQDRKTQEPIVRSPLLRLLGMHLALGAAMPRAAFGPFHHDAPAEKRGGRRHAKPLQTPWSRRALFYLAAMLTAWLPGWAVLSSMVPELRRAFDTSERAAARLCLAPLAAMTAGRLAVGLGARGKSLLKVRDPPVHCNPPVENPLR